MLGKCVLLVSLACFLFPLPLSLVRPNLVPQSFSLEISQIRHTVISKIQIGKLSVISFFVCLLYVSMDVLPEYH